MSKRVQILIEDCGIYLYDHIGGGDGKIFKILPVALSLGDWSDAEYLAAVIFRKMVEEDLNGNDRFGIGTVPHNDADLIFTLNCGDKTVVVNEYPNWSEEDRKELGIESVRRCSFEELVSKGASILINSHWSIADL